MKKIILNKGSARFALGAGISLTLVSVLLLVLPPSASAQGVSTDAEEIEEVVVTGTRRKDRTIADSNVPIDVIDGSDLASSGLTEINQLLSNLLPSFNFPLPSLTDGTDHVRPAQLRGLAPDHTLVLINGKRRHASALINLNGSVGRGSAAVDLNAIPANAIKRIEVLRDGAAAQYGSDAIAGVINIVLKDASEGGSVSITYSTNVTTMDGVPALQSVATDADGNLTFTTGDDRKRTDGETLTVRGNVGFKLTDDGFFNASVEYRNRNPTNRSDYDHREAYSRIGGALDPRELNYDRYNTRFGNARVEDVNIFYNAAMPAGAQELYSFGSYSKRQGDSAGFNRLPGNNRNVEAIYPDGFLPLITSDIDDVSFAFGLRGQPRGTWDYDVSVVYGQDKLNYGVINTLNTSLGPNSPTTFDAGTLTNEQLTLSADFSRLVNVNRFAGPLSIAFGMEYRDENYKIEAGDEASYIRGDFGPSGAVRTSPDDPFGASGSQVFPGFSPAAEVDDGRQNWSFYLDLDADITDAWNLSIASRFEDYSDFGSTLNWKIATRLELAESFALRSSVSSGFRAPSLGQQFFTSIATVFVNAVPTETGTFRPSSAVAVALGSPGLDAESSISFGVGFSWRPVDALTITVDYYNIKIDDRIVLSSNLSGTGIETLLMDTEANRARFFLNAISSTTQGVDVVASYSIGLGNAGFLKLNAGYNYSDNEVKDVIDPPAVLAAIGVDQGNLFDTNEFRRFEVGSPKAKFNLSANWLLNRWSFTARTVRYGETQDPADNPDRNEVLPSRWVTDLDIKVELTSHIALSFGANNVFDVYPRATRDNVVDVTTFSRILPYSGFSPFGFTGRSLYGKVTATF